jgi:GNAT superfamily N-acetyltransferase
MAELCADPVSNDTTGADSYAAGFRTAAVLRDGTPVCLRAIRADDKERLRTALQRLSHKSIHQRFFTLITELTPVELQHLTELDFRDHVGLVLTVEDETVERLIAVGRFVRVAPGSERAELALAVADEYQNRGAATLLLSRLVALARDCGVREFVAQMLPDNVEMLHLLQNSKYPLRQRLEDGLRHVALTFGTGNVNCSSGDDSITSSSYAVHSTKP